MIRHAYTDGICWPNLPSHLTVDIFTAGNDLNMRKVFNLSFVLWFLLLGSTGALAGERWSADKANRWYSKQPWLAGANFAGNVAGGFF
jgi:hypothetical protein